MNPLVCIFVGVLAGTCSGLFGIGGGIILVPILVLFFNFPQHLANGTSLVALLLPVGALGVLAYYRAGKLDMTHIHVGLLIAVGMFLGAYLGSKIAISLPDALLRRIFSVFLALVAIRMFFNTKS